MAEIKRLFVALLLGSIAASRAFAQIELDGSTTVQGALEIHHATLEAIVGRDIEFRATGSSLGLATLAAGETHIAMLAAPMEEVAAALNARNPGSVDLAQLRATRIGRASIAFIVNPRNRVRALSAAQLGDILVGKIKNWNEVGGSDAPISIINLANAGPLIPDALLHGTPITSAARAVPNATQIPGLVAQQINAIGIISTVHVKGPTSLITTDVNITVPLFLVTKGEPKPDEQKLIDAARKLLAGLP